MLSNNKLTYISLFSSAGIGCFGFKKAGFECIATNELLERRLNIQRINNKCKYKNGYINGDITKNETKKLIFSEIDKWKKEGNDKVDVIIATPPCQGMSVANHKKTENEIVRNSLVVESIKIINEIKPRFFIFENVAAFCKTGCTSPSGDIKEIGTVIDEELGSDYIIMSRVMNFKNYGSKSSRKRTVVIGVENSLAEYIAPIELYPDYKEEVVLKDVIGDMGPLQWGEFDQNDFYHQFRTYPKEMRRWIHDLKEGESAFDNEKIENKPHRVINGKIQVNQRKNGDKYTRQHWGKVGPCIHTRNDQMASQNTVHPVEDRVFSIRELMKLMSIPDEFKWINTNLEDLNSLDINEKIKILKKEEVNIRQSIGEAVPTIIFYQIASKISDFMKQKHLSSQQINDVVQSEKLDSLEKVIVFIENNPMNLGYATLARIAELTNSRRENNSAYFTNKFIINEICKELPEFNKEEIYIVEPSAGVGNFLPFIFKRYETIPKVHIDIVDIDKDVIKILKILLKKIVIPQNIFLNFICTDYLTFSEKHYDLTIGNPPFTKLKAYELQKYLSKNVNKVSTNLFEFFLEKAVRTSDHVAMITPKSLLNTPEFAKTREYLYNFSVSCIEDFGEYGFKGVLVETICIFIDVIHKPGKTIVKSLPLKKSFYQNQKYIFDKKLPYWIIYRNNEFDRILSKLECGIFTVFRDRQITNSNTTNEMKENQIRVLKSRNINDDGTQIIDIEGYDAYIDKEDAEKLAVYRYINNCKLYLTPNMTYNPRMMKMRQNVLVNGSIAILIPKENVQLSDGQMKYFSSKEYRNFYKIARNFQTRSLNIDSSSCYWFGKLKEENI